MLRLLRASILRTAPEWLNLNDRLRWRIEARSRDAPATFSHSKNHVPQSTSETCAPFRCRSCSRLHRTRDGPDDCRIRAKHNGVIPLDSSIDTRHGSRNRHHRARFRPRTATPRWWIRRHTAVLWTRRRRPRPWCGSGDQFVHFGLPCQPRADSSRRLLRSGCAQCLYPVPSRGWTCHLGAHGSVGRTTMEPVTR